MSNDTFKISSFNLLDSQFTSFHANIKSMLVFEIISFLGRHFVNNKPILHNNMPNLLNVGCAITTFPDWINADFFTFSSLIGKQSKHLNWMLDLRYPLNCQANIWDGIFCEHTIEHLYPLHVFNLFKEFHRTMKPGAWLRLSVPDLEKYISYYSGNVLHENFYQWSTGCEAICYLTQNYHHKSVWDAFLLANYLEKAGFSNIHKVGFQIGTDQRLLKDREARMWETFYMEAQKI